MSDAVAQDTERPAAAPAVVPPVAPTLVDVRKSASDDRSYAFFGARRFSRSASFYR